MKRFACIDFWFYVRRKLLLLLPLLLFTTLQSPGQKFTGKIIRVIDGDTYVFLTETGSFTVRMLGIDAPERDQPFSRESAVFLSKYLNKEAVTVVNGTDKEDRYMGVLFVNGKDINLLSIRGGFSWHYKRYSTDKDYAEAEEYAQKSKINIWSLPNPIPPWTWRLKHTSINERGQ